ncbi:hypothetical protein D3C72_649810 [compost metagenome]
MSIRNRMLGALALVACLQAPQSVAAHEPEAAPANRPFVSEDAPLIALTNARVIDGTGRAPLVDQTLLLRDGKIAAMGPSGSVTLPRQARRLDMTGKTVMPGLVQLHEHLWMFGGAVLSVHQSYPKLYLAAGVTTIRTAGAYNPYMDLKTRDDIAAGRAPGPWMDATVYMDLFGAPRLTDAASTARYLNFWLDSGFTSVKAYGYTGETALAEAIRIAHGRGLKVTGHLCAVTYARAAELGIDNIEHGFAMTPDFVPGWAAPQTPEEERACGVKALRGLDAVDPEGPQARALIADLVARKVAVTSTLPALEDLMADIPPQRGIDMLPEPLQAHHRAYRARLDDPSQDLIRLSPENFHKGVALELAFFRAGGLLVSGTDPAVPSAGVIAGYSSARQLELMVEHGFTPLEAIRISTLNGAVYLGREALIGSVEVGKQADLLIVEGDPSTHISDVRNAVLVFKQGVGYDPEALRASVRGLVGLQ